MDQGRGRSVAPTRPILRPQTRYKGQALFLAAPLYRTYHSKALTLQWPPARWTVLDLLGVSLTLLTVVEEYPAVLTFDPPEFPPEPMSLRAWAVQHDHKTSPLRRIALISVTVATLIPS